MWIGSGDADQVAELLAGYLNHHLLRRQHSSFRNHFVNPSKPLDEQVSVISIIPLLQELPSSSHSLTREALAVDLLHTRSS